VLRTLRTYAALIEPSASVGPANGQNLARTGPRRQRRLYVEAVPGERILLIEDDERIGSTLLRALHSSGYDTRWERTGHDGIQAATADQPALVVLDLGLPDVDGLDVCRTICERDPDLIVIMLTARDEELDIVVGLDAGAVDYITKPFTLAELLARLRAQLRRHTVPDGQTSTTGDLTIDTDARLVWLHGNLLQLRAKEFDLLARLLAQVGHVVSRETLITDVWDEHWHGSTKTLDFHIAALRRKIDDLGAASRITTVRGVGFRYETR